ncbi:hypothetical protein B0H17DRAFT_1150556 [Mycena rosella]|uniref:Dienelactone hydrolase domain-containing protein n=1 Tax=Mycena rosella TaxID=1033263 RepID=A0AAD7FNE3_MYCRO|nr:hypothetical protein B0H17DRAFT_1150556 [Mycena rosella]
MSCPDCFKGAVLEGEPTGIISSQFDGAYFATGGTSKRAIILLTDIFGLPLKNPKILADNFAKHLECDLSFFDLVKFVWGVLPSVPAMVRHRPSVVEARTISLVKKLQIAKKYELLGAIGYCFGGGIATQIGASKPELFNSIILVHPLPPTDGQIKAIKTPTAWSSPEDDLAIKPARLAEIERLYAARKGTPNFVEYEIKVYPEPMGAVALEEDVWGQIHSGLNFTLYAHNCLNPTVLKTL